MTRTRSRDRPWLAVGADSDGEVCAHISRARAHTNTHARTHTHTHTHTWQADYALCFCVVGVVGGAVGSTAVGYLVQKYKKTW